MLSNGRCYYLIYTNKHELISYVFVLLYFFVLFRFSYCPSLITILVILRHIIVEGSLAIWWEINLPRPVMYNCGYEPTPGCELWDHLAIRDATNWEEGYITPFIANRPCRISHTVTIPYFYMLIVQMSTYDQLNSDSHRDFWKQIVQLYS